MHCVMTYVRIYIYVCVRLAFIKKKICTLAGGREINPKKEIMGNGRLPMNKISPEGANTTNHCT